MTYQTTVPANRDAHVRSDRTGANYGSTSVLRANDDARIYLGFDIDKPKDAHLVSAVLQLVASGSGWVGTEVVSIRKLTDKWAESKVTWNNKPAADTTVVGGAAAGITAVGQVYSIDVTTIVGLGTAWRGLDVRVTSSGSTRSFRSSEYADKTLRPVLVLTWVEDPLEPVELSPSDGRVVATPNPTLTWDWVSPTEDLQQVQVQVDDATDFATPVYDSGFVAATDPRFALVGYSVPASTTRYWRVRIKTASGSTSPWSAAAQFSYVAMPALTITAPAAAFATNTPDITWTFIGQTKARAALYLGTAKEPLWRSAWLTTAQTVQVPTNIIKTLGATYRFEVEAWDGQDRQAITGVSDHATASVSRAFNLSGGTPALGLTATIPDPTKPMVRLTWTRTGDPNAFGIYVDGVLLQTVAGTLRTYDFWLARPQKAQTFQVAAGTGDPLQWSTGNATAVATPPCVGAWFYDEASGANYQVLDEGTNAYGFSDDLAYLLPSGRTYPVWQRSTTRGLEGIVQGPVRAQATRDGIEALWRAGNPVRLIIGDQTMKVFLGPPTVDWDPNGLWDMQVPVVQVAA